MINFIPPLPSSSVDFSSTIHHNHSVDLLHDRRLRLSLSMDVIDEESSLFSIENSDSLSRWLSSRQEKRGCLFRWLSPTKTHAISLSATLIEGESLRDSFLPRLISPPRFITITPPLKLSYFVSMFESFNSCMP